MKRPIVFLDLYCGAGGFSTGFAEAMKDLGLTFREIAINHWFRAVETMRANHPGVYAMQMDIDAATPDDIEADVIDHLHASPSCTHHSRAKGGKPRSNQLRSQPNEIWKFVDNKHVRWITIENVPEFTKWGPLTRKGKPIKRMEGSCFKAWLEQFTARGYDYEWRIINCADYGDATSRKRFFLIAVKRGCGKIRWPKPTHAEVPGHGLKRWQGVRKCLDMEDLGRSIFEPGRNLAVNTLRRVDVGMQKFNGMSFLMDMLGAGEDDEKRVHLLTKPMPVQHASGNRFAVVRPFIVKMNNHADAEDIEKPLTTVLSGGQHHALCTPFIVRANRGCFAESIDKPLSSQQAHTVHHALCQPIIIDHFKNGEAHSVDEPLGAQTTHDRYSVATPFIVEHRRNGKAKSLDGPIGTQTTKDKFSICTPLIVDMSHPAGNDSGHIGSADEPIRTITTFDNIQVATPILVDGVDVSHLPQLPDGRYLDILLRMLKPSELAAAHSFPKDYRLSGSRTEQVKQIGNSVPVRTAKAAAK